MLCFSNIGPKENGHFGLMLKVMGSQTRGNFISATFYTSTVFSDRILLDVGKGYSFIVYCKISSAKFAPGSTSFIDDVTFCLKLLFLFFLFGKAVLFEMASSSFMKVCVDRCKKYIYDSVEPLLWDTSIQGTPPFTGRKMWSRKNAHIIFVSITSI